MSTTLEHVELFRNTAPGGNGGLIANVTFRIPLDTEDYAEAVAKIEDALYDFTKPDVSGADDDQPGPEKPARRRRAKKEDEDEKEEKPARRRRAKKEDEDEDEKEEKPTRRRRRAKKEDDEDGPSQEDVAKAASDLAEACGSKLAAEIISEFSDTGKIADIPQEKREDFIKEAKFQMEDDD